MLITIDKHRNNVIVSLTDDENFIDPTTKPEVIELVRQIEQEKVALIQERDNIDRRQEPEKYATWMKNYQQWGFDWQAHVNTLQFGG